MQPGIKTPPSLINIFKEVKANYPEFNIPKHGYLGSWASQGVLCLNTCLTVRAHNANSHAKQGWEEFTDAVLKLVNKHGGEGLSENKHKGVVFLAWGKPAEKRTAGVDKSKHLILTSPVSSSLAFKETVLAADMNAVMMAASVAIECCSWFSRMQAFHQGQ